MGACESKASVGRGVEEKSMLGGTTVPEAEGVNASGQGSPAAQHLNGESTGSPRSPRMTPGIRDSDGAELGGLSLIHI